MNLRVFEQTLNEAIALPKPKSDFSGLKWGARLEGSRVYRFKMGGHDYLLDFTIDTYLTEMNYILRWDVRTMKKEFELVPLDNPFELTDIITKANVETIRDIQKGGYQVSGLKMYYVREPNEEKNVRAIVFNRAIHKAFEELGLKYDTEVNEIRGIVLYEFTFREK
jgi:hypothetical protein